MATASWQPARSQQPAPVDTTQVDSIIRKHIADGISPLGSEGIPYGYESFELVGRCRSFGSGCERAAPARRRGELPLGNRLIRFPP